MSRSADEAPLMAVRGLACGYAERTVLQDVDFELKPGTATILLGPNGSGKSTLLKTLAKSLAPLAGEIEVLGQPLSALSFAELARRAAYVPQEEAAPFRFTVRQVVLMGRLPHSSGFFDTAEDRHAADEAMREADCFDLADRPINEISGGERQRALIARALAQEAPLLLLDEPTSHLDIGHQVAIAQLVRKLCRDGRAVLAAMHDLNLASEMGSEAILLSGGRVALHETVEQVLADPKLDQTYGVPFHRFADGTGRLRVFAATASGS